MPPGVPQEVFLSHSSENRRFATKLARVLRDHGISVWYSETHIVGARQWHDEIGAALGRCDWFLVVLSPEAVASKWVKRELLYAINDNRYDERIVPIHYRSCEFTELSWVLESIQLVEFRRGHKQGYRDLLRIWGLEPKAD